jgi:hypothetical protein
LSRSGSISFAGVAFVGIGLLSAPARAVDVTFAGSGALDYRAFAGHRPPGSDLPSAIGTESLVFELAQKLIVDVSPRMSATVKICFGCHGIEVDQAFAELHLTDSVNFRIGRINVPVGEFNTRHDPANYTAPSKPLPYAMGDMLYYGRDDFNLGVVPTPYVDDGIEVFGSVAMGEVLFDYSVYGVKGFAGQNDLDFAASRRFADNNLTPAVGGRAVLSVGPVSIGGSIGGGNYDAHDELAYFLFGGEAYARWGPFVLRGEYIARRTDINPKLPGYRFAIRETYIIKEGYYGQLDWELGENLSLIYRFDALNRNGVPLPGSRIDEVFAGIQRHTGAVALRPWGGVLLKAGYERWLFSGVPFPDQHVVRVGVIYSY